MIKDFTLVSIGGGGPMHSETLARELGIKSNHSATSSVFASWGMLMSDIRHDYSQTLLVSFKDINYALNELTKMIEEAENICIQKDRRIT